MAVCKRCKSSNVKAQALSEVKEQGHGCLYQLTIGWVISFWKWMYVGFVLFFYWGFYGLWMMIFKLIRGEKFECPIWVRRMIHGGLRSETNTYWVCQDCGFSFSV